MEEIDTELEAPKCPKFYEVLKAYNHLNNVIRQAHSGSSLDGFHDYYTKVRKQLIECLKAIEDSGN